MSLTLASVGSRAKLPVTPSETACLTGGTLEAFVISSDTVAANRVIRSPNGVSSTVVATGTVNRSWPGIAYSPTLRRLVMVSSAAVPNAVGYSDDDGLTWTFVPSADDTKSWTVVRWISELGLFVAGSNSTFVQDTLMTSPNGINWTARTPVASFSQYHAITYIGGRLVVGGLLQSNPLNVVTTLDFVTWAGPFGATANRTVGLSKSGGGFIYSFGTTGDVGRSADGNAWAARGTIGVAGNPSGLSGIANAPEIGMVVVCSDPNGLWSSPDGGLNWTQRIVGRIPSVVWAPNRRLFVASQAGTVNFRTSPDGINWAVVAAGTNQDWNGVTAV